jgi:hypothetical protein
VLLKQVFVKLEELAMAWNDKSVFITGISGFAGAYVAK